MALPGGVLLGRPGGAQRTAVQVRPRCHIFSHTVSLPHTLSFSLVCPARTRTMCLARSDVIKHGIAMVVPALLLCFILSWPAIP